MSLGVRPHRWQDLLLTAEIGGAWRRGLCSLSAHAVFTVDITVVVWEDRDRLNALSSLAHTLSSSPKWTSGVYPCPPLHNPTSRRSSRDQSLMPQLPTIPRWGYGCERYLNANCSHVHLSGTLHPQISREGVWARARGKWRLSSSSWNPPSEKGEMSPFPHLRVVVLNQGDSAP